MKPCVVAVYAMCMVMLSSCWPGTYRVWACVEPCDDTIVSEHIGAV